MDGVDHELRAARIALFLEVMVDGGWWSATDLMEATGLGRNPVTRTCADGCTSGVMVMHPGTPKTYRRSDVDRRRRGDRRGGARN